MGEKRVSWSAEVSAKSDNPDCKGSGEKVPMQPRRCNSEPWMVFQVTKRGDSVMGSEDVDDAGVVIFVEAIDAGVESPDDDRRESGRR